MSIRTRSYFIGDYTESGRGSWAERRRPRSVAQRHQDMRDLETPAAGFQIWTYFTLASKADRRADPAGLSLGLPTVPERLPW